MNREELIRREISLKNSVVRKAERLLDYCDEVNLFKDAPPMFHPHHKALRVAIKNAGGEDHPLAKGTVVEKVVYTFDELEDDAKEKARAWWREGSFDDGFWHECTTEDAKAIALLMGIEIDKIYFTGFWSQGDGAQFTGDYSYVKGSAKAVKSHAPQDKELHRIAEELAEFQKRFFYSVEATIKTQGHYCHSGCTVIDGEDQHGGLNCEDDEELATILRSYMDWIYGQLEKEYDYQNADAQVDDNIRANEYEFTEEGERYV